MAISVYPSGTDSEPLGYRICTPWVHGHVPLGYTAIHQRCAELPLPAPTCSCRCCGKRVSRGQQRRCSCGKGACQEACPRSGVQRCCTSRSRQREHCRLRSRSDCRLPTLPKLVVRLLTWARQFSDVDAVT